jgi:hypothetical protein
MDQSICKQIIAYVRSTEDTSGLSEFLCAGP